MAKQTVLEAVRERMQTMQDAKAAELDKISTMQQEARSKIEAAGLAMRQATEKMDVDAYEEAKAAKSKAQTALDMYSGRYTQIAKREYITEEESDSVIDSLLEYEDQLAAKFKAAVGEHLKSLAGLLEEYRIAIADTEQVITSWQLNIHENYNTRGGMTFTDKVTGNRTDRSPSPVPVHTIPYRGCAEAARLEEYLVKEDYAHKRNK